MLRTGLGAAIRRRFFCGSHAPRITPAQIAPHAGCCRAGRSRKASGGRHCVALSSTSAKAFKRDLIAADNSVEAAAVVIPPRPLKAASSIP
jgi:hypothetical protein